MSSQPAFLVIEKGKPFYNREVFKIRKNGFSIGRASELGTPDLALSSEFISRKHAMVSYRNGSYYIVDISLHGVKINGQPIQKETAVKLKHGDKIFLAKEEAVMAFYIGTYPSDTARIFTGQDRMNELEIIRIILDEDKREIIIEGRQINLTGNLYTLFCLLYQKRGSAVCHKEIKRMVWPERTFNNEGEPQVGDEELAALIKRLRVKLGNYQNIIDNVRGYGYILK